MRLLSMNPTKVYSQTITLTKEYYKIELTELKQITALVKKLNCLYRITLIIGFEILTLD